MSEKGIVGMPQLSQDEVIKAYPSPEAEKTFYVDQQYQVGALNTYPQFSLLGEALMIYHWHYRPEQRAFVAENYGVGFQIFDGDADPRLNDPFAILGKQDPPVKGCPNDVFRLSRQLDTGLWHRDERADEFYLEHTEFNAGCVLEHAAVMAYNMVQGQRYVIHGHPRLYDTVIKSYRRSLWRLNGYVYSEFKDAYKSMYGNE